jgi:hypothetical protein
MKRTTAGMVVLGIATLTVVVSAQQQTAKTGSHVGTWLLVSFNYSNGDTFSDAPKEVRRIKLITDTHFTWVHYDTATQKVQVAAGGSYTLKGDTYSEMIDFGTDDMKELLGKEQVFKLRVEGDKLYQSGHLSSGQMIEEVWQRMK